MNYTGSYSLLYDFLFLVKKGELADIIQNEASTDAMTKLKNRFTFEHDINSIPEKDWEDYSFVMLDLNYLKLFNDKHGHDMGDYYIIITSEVIQDYFSKYGTVYRIGGDEFCVLARNLEESQFMEIQREMEHYMTTLRIPSIKLDMSISSGYASFNPVLDNHLRDTMKRADAKMYERKFLLKKALNSP